MGIAPHVEIHTQDVLIKHTMTEEAAVKVKEAFERMGARGEALSYMDCVLFDAALDVLGEEKAYYGYGDDEWEEIQRDRKKAEASFGTVKTIDVSETWREITQSPS